MVICRVHRLLIYWPPGWVWRCLAKGRTRVIYLKLMTCGWARLWNQKLTYCRCMNNERICGACKGYCPIILYKPMGKHLRELASHTGAQLVWACTASFGNIKPGSSRTGANSNLRQHYVALIQLGFLRLPPLGYYCSKFQYTLNFH